MRLQFIFPKIVALTNWNPLWCVSNVNDDKLNRAGAQQIF